MNDSGAYLAAGMLIGGGCWLLGIGILELVEYFTS